MGLASLRQYQANTLRRSEECLTTSSPNSSASDSEVAAANGDHQRGSNLILDQQPVRKFKEKFLFSWKRNFSNYFLQVWTRQTPIATYGRSSVPPADTDTLPSSDDDDDDYAPGPVHPDLSPGSDLICTSGLTGSKQTADFRSRDHVDVQEQRIFVKNASGGFVGLTPNQLQQMHMMADMQVVEPPQHLRGGGNGNHLRLTGSSSSAMATSNHHRSNLWSF